MNFKLKDAVYRLLGFGLGIVVLIWGVQANFDFPLLIRAERGDVQAEKAVARMNVLHPDKALKWFLRAAEQGDAEAQMMAGDAYHSLGNDADAAPWLRKAAEQGTVAPELGEIYFDGRGGVAQSDADAAKFLRQALEQGRCGGKAVPDLVQLYLEGRGVTKSAEDACFWSFATADAVPDAATWTKTCPTLDVPALARVQLRLQDWKKAHPKACAANR
jgi:TPR repeat protein